MKGADNLYCHCTMKALLNKTSKFLHRYINGTKGVISLFLALLMVPFASIAGALINAGRINSAIAIFDEALCNASNSTLGTYDEFLRKRFGLLAMSQGEDNPKYTPEQFITETFQKYMEENCKSLSNTYIDAEYDAAGVYPLADTDVLLTQVFEYSKYTVPTKMVIDGLSLQSLLDNLTDSLNKITNIFKTLGNGADLADQMIDCNEKMNTAKTALDTLVEKKKAYEEAFPPFEEAVKDYNDLIDELDEYEKAEADAKDDYDAAKEIFDEAQDEVDDIKDEIEDIDDEIDELKEEDDEDNDDEIKDLREEKKELKKELNDAEDERDEAEAEKNDANDAWKAAEEDLQNHRDAIADQRAVVKEKRTAYSTAIGELAAQVETAGGAVKAAQGSLETVASKGAKLAESVAKNVSDYSELQAEKQIKELKENKKAAEDRGDNTAAYLWQDKIDEAENNRVDLKNQNKIEDEQIGAVGDAISSIKTFSEQNTQKELEGKFNTLKETLDTLKANVDAYSIPETDIKMGETTSLHITVTLPIDPENIVDMLTEMAEDLTIKALIGIIKAITSFVSALINVEGAFNEELNATINEEYYNRSIGGLPSKNQPLKSQFEDEDSALSEYYKKLLGEHSINGDIEGSAAASESLIDVVTKNIKIISDKTKEENAWAWNNILGTLGTIGKAILDIVKGAIVAFNQFVSALATKIGQKLLLVGYIGYNTANRTTCKGEALTGEPFSLPKSTIEYGFNKDGYTFCGAETEYIIRGHFSEKQNQTELFSIIFLVRFVLDIPFVIMNAEVTQIATAAGAPTFGIGTIIVYVLYFLAEPLVDTLILVNSESVPIIKTKIFLTPSGIVDLIGKFFKMTLNEQEKHDAYALVVEVMGAGYPDEDFPDNFADAKEFTDKVEAQNPSSGDSSLGQELLDSLEFDYTKTLIVVMILFGNSQEMAERLADIIQMECTYQATNKKKDAVYNLSKSFTFLRASGQFSTNEFIRLSAGNHRSTKRVVYRGY